MLTYDECTKLLGSRSERWLKYATYLKRTMQGYGVYYHCTAVVEIFSSGCYRLNTGGWHTRTMKERINEYSPVTIVQRDREWTVLPDKKFRDGMIVGSNGRIY